MEKSNSCCYQYVLKKIHGTLFLGILLILPSSVYCQQDKNDNILKFPSYADSTFLVIEGNLLEPEVVWSNIAAFVRAGDRLEQHLFVENGFFKWNVDKGADIKISENIFQHFLYIWKEANKKLKTGNYEIRNIGGRKFAVPKNVPKAPSL